MANMAEEYVEYNKANWNERAVEHAKSDEYCFKRLQQDPSLISDVVRFDTPLIGSIDGLDIVHLQCHIGTDTLSLARRGAKSVTGLDFSSESLKQARNLAANAAGGDKLSFVEASTYVALSVLQLGSFDLVFTGIGALCWLPSIKRWAEVVAGLLKPGGRLFLREGHPILWSIGEENAEELVISLPYFERAEPMIWVQGGTYVDVGSKVFENTKTMEWNHGMGEIIQAVLDVGLKITGLVEHKSVPWKALSAPMAATGPCGEWELKQGKDNIPLTYTLQAVKT
ncbi:Methyltransferase phqN [Pseudocercospora fuligena]|uniref:Methyltransferase phqN n=1 Tax=Pseudocercospora fuligena TaxID=685502 RepID=A0A8H6VGD7_9PEZI|nr:Methyltransferase phqN [Pseudocercospora fuligena]